MHAPSSLLALASPDLTARLAVSAALSEEMGTGVTFIGGEHSVELSWAQLHREAKAIAADLQARGVQPGHHVAILGPTTRALVTAVQATWLCGACVVMLPLPMRLGSLDEFVQLTRTRIRNADAHVVLVDADLAAFVDVQPGDAPVMALDQSSGATDDFEVPAIDPDSLAILQFTSGSTAAPKGVMLPHRQVCANVDAITVGAALDPGRDVAVSWLPLYHDMGLIGLLITPMCTSTRLVLATPQDFLAAPRRWMEWIATYRGTVTAGPNFSYALAGRALGRGGALDLSSLRLALNGAEPVDPDAVEAFVAAGARHGLSASAMFPAFGMAEATLAVTFPPTGCGMRTDCIDRVTLESERYAAPVSSDHVGARRLARLGAAVPGLEVRIVDPSTGLEMLEREAGELEVRGTSITTGYYRQAEATAAVFHDGWLRTGDLAYMADGDLVVCGRLKDVIILGGRNVFPEDIERAVAQVQGVRVGNVVAFGITVGGARRP